MQNHDRRTASHWKGVGLTLLVAMNAATCLAADSTAAAERLRQTEQAFADTMADRDLNAFASFLAEDTVFFASEDVDRGKGAVVARWSAAFEGEDAPFSWAPEHVEVLEAGDLGFSSGPVYDAEGRRTATFHSVWRLEPDGVWRIVFDKGTRWCPDE
jgi:ketosteroid isomerase-like protein